MKSENILQADLLDIVFENRNKAYGAYELRKHYKGRLVKAMTLAFLLAGGILSMAMMVKKEKVTAAPVDDLIVCTMAPLEPEAKKPDMPKKPAAPKPPAKAPSVAQQKFVQNFVITKNDNDADKLSNDLDKVAIGTQTTAGEPPSGPVAKDPVPAAPGSGNDMPAPVDKLTPTWVADIMPAYPGGMNALKKFMEKNLQSFDDIEDGKVISVKITFVVGYDGKLKGFQVLEDGGDMYNKEVIRVLKKMPEWIPGKARGENVSVYYTIPVKFTSAE